MKKWLLSKLLLLLGLSSFGQILQPNNNTYLNESTAPPIPQVNFLPPTFGDVEPELAAALQHMLDSLATEFSVPGLSAAMITPSGDVWKGTSGINSATMIGDTLSVDMRLGMGSVTKTFTGAVIMQLVEEGVLTLEDSLDQWLPAYPNVDSSVTIRQLLNHTSGIYNFTDGSAFANVLNNNLDSIFTPESILASFVEPPIFSPGTSWGYSNTNYLLLGLIIEAATGNDFADELRTRLLEPFGHNTMSLHPDEMPTGEIAHLWLDLTGNGIPDDFTGAGLSLNGLFSMAWAAGSLITTPEDLAHWVKNLMTGQVVQQSTLDDMMVAIPLGGGFSYGLSLMKLEIGGYDWWGHNGSIGYLTNALYSPDLDISMVLISNSSPFNELGLTWISLVQTYLDFNTVDTEEYLLTQNDLLIYPNPFSNEFLIAIDLENPSPLQLTVTNQLGQIVHEVEYEIIGQGMNNLLVNGCGHWLPGIYQVELKGDNWMVSEKIIKE